MMPENTEMYEKQSYRLYGQQLVTTTYTNSWLI